MTKEQARAMVSKLTLEEMSQLLDFLKALEQDRQKKAAPVL